jgi:outer membrane receptor protein involved in Fe transport
VTVAAPAFKSETLTNFELGVKTTWNNIFRFNAAIYLENWDNIQYGVVVAGAQGAGYTGNAGTARSRAWNTMPISSSARSPSRPQVLTTTAS